MQLKISQSGENRSSKRHISISVIPETTYEIEGENLQRELLPGLNEVEMICYF